MDETCSRDELVRRVASEVKPDGGARNRKINRPDMDSAQRASHAAVIYVYFDTPELAEFHQLPQDYGRN